jgi:hypothetical protein
VNREDILEVVCGLIANGIPIHPRVADLIRLRLGELSSGELEQVGDAVWARKIREIDAA